MEAFYKPFQKFFQSVGYFEMHGGYLASQRTSRDYDISIKFASVLKEVLKTSLYKRFSASVAEFLYVKYVFRNYFADGLLNAIM